MSLNTNTYSPLRENDETALALELPRLKAATGLEQNLAANMKLCKQKAISNQGGKKTV